jgi:diacylglycerol kinase family enzyme
MGIITLVTNAAAGSTDDDAISAVTRVLGERFEVVTLRVSDEQPADQLMADATGSVVIAGGDGSLHACLGALERHGRLGDVLIGLVPLGTGNDFARGVHLPLDDPAAAAQVFLDGVRREVDLIRDDAGGVVVNAVHLGVGADAGRKAQPWKDKLGGAGYAVGAVLAGLQTDGHQVRVVADGRVLADGRRRALQVAVGNGSTVGGGTPLLPDADPHDGQLDVMVSFAVSPMRRLGYALRLRRGTHERSGDVVTARTSVVEITGPDLWLNADGEILGPVSRRRWTVVPRAFTMMLPATGPATPVSHG